MRDTSLFLPKLGQGNIFTSVCQEFCSQGGLPQCMLGYHHPPTDKAAPPGPTPPPGPDPPERSMLGDTVNKRAVLNIGSIRICILTTGVVSNETNTYVRMYT